LTLQTAPSTSEEPPERPLDPRNWEGLYEAFGEKVFRLAYRLTRRADVAADLTHDTFVRVFQRQGQYEHRGDVGAWVYRVAANLVRDHLRRPRLFVPYAPASDPESRSGPASRAHPAMRVQLERSLSTLPEEQRVVLLLHELDGFTHEEIGAALGIAPGTSKARLSRARSALRVELHGTE